MNPLLIVLAFGAGVVALGLWAVIDHLLFGKRRKRARAQQGMAWGEFPC